MLKKLYLRLFKQIIHINKKYTINIGEEIDI